MDDHVGLEGLFLNEALEADVTLEGPDAVVDEHVPLQVGRQRELPRTHVTLVAFHPLRSPDKRKQPFVRLDGATGGSQTLKATLYTERPNDDIS